jgi:hypothetical protein
MQRREPDAAQSRPCSSFAKRGDQMVSQVLDSGQEHLQGKSHGKNFTGEARLIKER